MHVRCPHCHTPVDVVDDHSFRDITCTSCGSNFSLVGETEATQTAQGVAKSIGHFELIESVGVGSFGTVWKAKDTQLDRMVAIKIPRRGQLSDEETEQFLREARAAAQVRHANIVSVHEVGKADESVYIVSDYVQGADLKRWLDGRPLPPKEAALLAARIAEALDHAHEAGVVHRDLKPGNVMMDLDGNPHIMDFGLAKRDSGDVTMTVDGAILGTPAYMSPEQARGEGHGADRRSDVYSLGVMLFEMLTGDLPFKGDKQMLVVRILTEDPPQLRRLNARIPKDLETVCLKCLEKDAGQRYPTAKAVEEELRRFLRGEAVLARPVSVANRGWRWCKRNPVVAGLGGALAAALLAMAIAGPLLALWQTRLAKRNAVRGLAARSQALREILPVQSLLVAAKAVENAVQLDGMGLRVSHEALLTATHNVGGLPLMGHKGRVNEVLITPDGHRAVTVGSETARMWDLEADNPAASCVILGGVDSRYGQALATTADSRWLATIAKTEDGELPSILLWDLQRMSTNAPSFSLGGHDDRIHCLAISPDGKWLVSGGDDNTVRVCELTDDGPGNSRFVLPHAASVCALAVGPDSRWLATADVLGAVQLWDLSATRPGESSREMVDTHESQVWSIAISNDGRWLASGSNDSARLWDLTDKGRAARILQGHKRGISCVKFSPDGRWLATGSYDNTVRLWDLKSDRTTKSSHVLRGHLDMVWLLDISPDSRWLVTGSHDATARLWDLASEDPAESPVTLRAHEDTVAAVKFGPRGRWLVSGSWDSTARLWDLAADNPASPYVLHCPLNGQTSLLKSPGGRFAVAAGRGEVRVWEFTSSEDLPIKPARTLRTDDMSTPRIAVSQNYLAAAWNGNVHLWNFDALASSPRVFRASGGPIQTIAIDATEHWLVAGDDDTTAEFWDLGDDDAPSRQLPGYQATAMEFALQLATSPDGQWLATAKPSQVRLWNLQSQDPVAAPVNLPDNSDGTINRMAFSPDSRWLVTQHREGRAGLWDLSEPANPQWRELTAHSGFAFAVAFTPDSRRLATASWSGTSQLWERSADSAEMRSVEFDDRSRAALYAVAISPDGRWMVTAGEDTVVRLWDLTATKPAASFMSLRGHTGAIVGTVFSPDSRWVISGSFDGTFRLWDLDVDRSVRRAYQLAGRALTERERQESFLPASD